MRKHIFIIIFSILSIILSSCMKIREDTEVDGLYTILSAGNLHNGSYVVKYHDDYIYANPNDYNSLYRMNIDSGDVKKISGDHYFYEINVYGDDIYYTSSSPGEVWRISVNGKNKVRICEDKVGNLIVHKNKIYYRLSEDDNWGKLYAINLDGSDAVQLSDSVGEFCIKNEKIYFSNIENDYSLCEMNIDGTGKKILSSVCADFINIYDETNLVYSDNKRNGAMFSYNIHTREERCITEDKSWDINIYSGWILYRNQSDGGSLWCVDFKTGDKIKLISGNLTGIIVLGDIVFYRQITENSGYYYFNIKNALNNPEDMVVSVLE